MFVKLRHTRQENSSFYVNWHLHHLVVHIEHGLGMYKPHKANGVSSALVLVPYSTDKAIRRV